MAKEGELRQLQVYLPDAGYWAILAGEYVWMPAGSSVILRAFWANTGTETFAGRVSVSVTKPDGSVLTLPATEGQDTGRGPGGMCVVTFEAFTADISGYYDGSITLADASDPAVALDEWSPYPLIDVPDHDMDGVVPDHGASVATGMAAMMITMMMMGIVVKSFRQ